MVFSLFRFLLLFASVFTLKQIFHYFRIVFIYVEECHADYTDYGCDNRIHANAIEIEDSTDALWTLSCASNPPAARIQPSAAVPTPEPTFIQKEEAAFPILYIVNYTAEPKKQNIIKYIANRLTTIMICAAFCCNFYYFCSNVLLVHNLFSESPLIRDDLIS